MRANTTRMRAHIATPSTLAAYVTLTRPFTLVMPALGMLTGGTIALGAQAAPAHGDSLLASVWLRVALGTVMAALLNGASNALNQVYDLEIDRINKPDRPLPAGHLTVDQAMKAAIGLYVVANALALLVGLTCGVIVAVTTFATWAYSAPPLRWKRLLYVANLTVAVPRGALLKVAGWSAVASVFSLELWFIALIFGVFVFGAVSTKDFSDVQGDSRHGCVTLPGRFGARVAAKLIAPFLFVPTASIALGLAAGWLSGDRRVLAGLAAVLAVWAGYVVHLMLSRPEARLSDDNQASWTHVYLMSFALQIGFALAYIP